MTAAVAETDVELTPEGLDVLMSAVRIARDGNVRTLAVLKSRLAAVFPKTEESVVDAALKYWANHLKKTGALLN